MNPTLWRYELRRAGTPAVLAPAFAAAVGAVVIAAVSRSGGGPGTVPAGLRDILEMALPLAVGVAVTTLVGRDVAVELQLTVPVGYRGTLLRRAAATVAGAVPVAILLDAVLRGERWQPHGVLAGQLVWAAPTLALAALGLLLAAVLREPAAAGAALTTVWLFQQLAPRQVPEPLYLFASSTGFTGDWLANRVTLLAAAGAGLAAAWAVLGRRSWLLAGAGAR